MSFDWTKEELLQEIKERKAEGESEEVTFAFIWAVVERAYKERDQGATEAERAAVLAYLTDANDGRYRFISDEVAREVSIRHLPTDPTAWRLNRTHGGPEFGITVTAMHGHGDTTFGFEVNSLDPTCEQAARDDGFPEPVIAAALKIAEVAAEHRRKEEK